MYQFTGALPSEILYAYVATGKLEQDYSDEPTSYSVRRAI